MKRIILFTIIVMISTPIMLYSQDNKYRERYNQIIEKMASLDSTSNAYQQQLLSLSSFYFSPLKDKDIELGNYIIDLMFTKANKYKKSTELNKWLRNMYVVNNKNQSIKIRNYINENIKPTSPYFFEIVSNFKLVKYIPYLESYINSNLLEELKKGKPSKEVIWQMKCMATLTNLGNQEMEEYLINTVNDLYKSYFNEEQTSGYWVNKIDDFYEQIVANTLKYINSKNCVYKTIYLLDDLNDDIFNRTSYKYYGLVIEPKITEYLYYEVKNKDFFKVKEAVKRGKWYKIKSLDLWRKTIRK